MSEAPVKNQLGGERMKGRETISDGLSPAPKPIDAARQTKKQRPARGGTFRTFIAGYISSGEDRGKGTETWCHRVESEDFDYLRSWE